LQNDPLIGYHRLFSFLIQHKPENVVVELLKQHLVLVIVFISSVDLHLLE